MVDVSRVQKELTECNRDREVSGVSIALHDGSTISHLTGTIAGPQGTPYEGGTFVIDIRLPGTQSPPLFLAAGGGFLPFVFGRRRDRLLPPSHLRSRLMMRRGI